MNNLDFVSLFLNDGGNEFFLHLLPLTKITYDSKLPAPAGVSVTSKINLFINPELFFKYTPRQQRDIVTHEFGHVIMQHTIRGGKDKFTNLSPMQKNIAADLAINQILGIDDTIEEIGGVNISRFSEALNQAGYSGECLPFQSFEYYAQILSKVQQDFSDKFSQIDDHDQWEQSESSTMQSEVIKEALKDAYKKTSPSRRKSDHLNELIKELIGNSKVNWVNKFRNIVASSLSPNNEHTRKKRNRRTGILNPGKRRIFEPTMSFIIDVSGSMTDDYISQIWNELSTIDKLYPELKIYIIQVDTEIQSCELFDSITKPKRNGWGGTLYQPGITKAMELKSDIIVFAGDFDCADVPNKPRCSKFIWLGVTDQKPPVEWGQVLRINS